MVVMYEAIDSEIKYELFRSQESKAIEAGSHDVNIFNIAASVVSYAYYVTIHMTSQAHFTINTRHPSSLTRQILLAVTEETIGDVMCKDWWLKLYLRVDLASVNW